MLGGLDVPRTDVVGDLARARGDALPADQQAALEDVAALRSFGHHGPCRYLDVGVPGLRHDNLRSEVNATAFTDGRVEQYLVGRDVPARIRSSEGRGC